MRGIRKSTPHSNAANAVKVANAAKAASLAVAAMMALALSVSGCTLEVPADPDGTLDRIEDEGILRAGASPDPQTVKVNGSHLAAALALITKLRTNEQTEES